MEEMQGIRMVHCTIWSGGVREIVSAEDANIKFILTDHPVAIYNHAAPPTDKRCADPHDPSIALKGSQTIFPLNRDFCLILTNLEYARDPAANPLEKRTFARNFRDTIVRADGFIRERKLTDTDVARINFILKSRARRYIAAGREEWLYPERVIAEPWTALKATLQPREDALWQFGGEMYVRYESGEVRYQDEFGRSEEQWAFLTKDTDERILRPASPCGCGSGKKFKTCCQLRPQALRPSWKEASIRERNLFFYQALAKELGLAEGKDWVEVRRSLTDEQIARLYSLFAALWPRDTDVLSLLPRPDGTARAIYTGPIHPETLTDFALGAPLYFGEVLIEHPFLHASSVRKEYSPVENPRMYRQEFLKAALFFLTLIPLVHAGAVNLVPDLCNFDLHLRDQMHLMAQRRMAGVEVNPNKDPRLKEVMWEDTKRSMMAFSPETLKALIRQSDPDLDEEGMKKALAAIDYLKKRDPLAVLQGEEEPEGDDDDGERRGSFHLHKVVPNFELAMYLAQATGSCIITDNRHRWEELVRTIRWRPGQPTLALQGLSQAIGAAEFAMPEETNDVLTFSADTRFSGYPVLMREAYRYTGNVAEHGAKANFEASIASRFSRLHASVQGSIGKSGVPVSKGKLRAAFAWGGFQHNTVNRLLLMSSSERHLPSVPMAFFFEPSPADRKA